jgi:hypothetical protein
MSGKIMLTSVSSKNPDTAAASSDSLTEEFSHRGLHYPHIGDDDRCDTVITSGRRTRIIDN